MYFLKSMPWLCKIAAVLVALFKRQHHTLGIDALRTPFLLAVLLLLSTTLPSMVFSVRHRAVTTEFLMQMLLFAAATGAVTCSVFRSAEQRPYAAITVHFMLMHLFYSVLLAVHANKRLVLYPSAVKALSAACFLGLATALLVATPQLDMQVLPTLAVLFVSETTGCLVLLVSSVLRAVADMYAAFFDSYL